MKISKEEKAKKVALEKKREIYHKELVQKQNKNISELKPYEGDAFISLQHINKIYPNHVQAVFDFNLDIKEKEFIVFVGPSGCGKSTTLRMIAGLEDITYGNLFIKKQFGNTLLPKERDCAMVFQSYALYPNMTVYDNMAFSLRTRHIDNKEINTRVIEAAKILELSDYLGRKPAQLSGGQRQRVALGRAIVRNAQIFLMDEPLSNLDAKLRVQMRSEIVSLHKKIGSTTIYVTHDQTEAMTMADRIVVMKDGYIQQIGTPKEIYNNPNNVFVATFIGAPAMNILNVKVSKDKITLPNGLVIKISKKQMELFNESLREEINLLQSEISKLEDDNKKISLPLEEQKDKIYQSRSFRKRIPDILKINEDKINQNKERIKVLERYQSNKELDALLGIRPEDIVSKKASQIIEHASDSFSLLVDQAELLGNEYYIYSELDNKKIIAKVSANEEVNTNEEMEFAINLKNIHLFDKDSEKRYF